MTDNRKPFWEVARYNTVTARIPCPSCGRVSDYDVSFEYGIVDGSAYALRDRIAPPDEIGFTVGDPTESWVAARSDVLSDGEHAEGCPWPHRSHTCTVHIVDQVIREVVLDDDKYLFLPEQENGVHKRDPFCVPYLRLTADGSVASPVFNPKARS